MRKTLLTTVMVLALAGCQRDEAPAEQAAPAPAPTPPAESTPAPEPAAAAESSPAQAFAAKLDSLLAGEHRGADNRARDAFRHPKETLAFFGIAPGLNVVEITPGRGGWYTEILAPLMTEDGSYTIANLDPGDIPDDRTKTYITESNQALSDKLAAAPQLYGNAQVVEFSQVAPSFGAPGSADLVLTFRNVHNWMASNSVDAMFAGFFQVLKPGGVLGVVEHRAKPDDTRPVEEIAKTGYLPEQMVIDAAVKAGFELVDKSEINANAADTKDHPNGVWTLPPRSEMKDIPEADHAKYKAIGESDRMTIKFMKPAATTED